MKCSQCGADFDEQLSQCPYCGALNYSGAERQYFDHLHDLNQEMAEMGDDSEESYTAGIKKGTRIFLTVFIALGIVAAVVIILVVTYARISAKKDSELYHANMQWKREYYSQLDELYDAGKYDEILTFLDEHVNDKGYYPYVWEHLDFINIYNHYYNFQIDTPYFDDENLVYKTLTLYDILSLESVDLEAAIDLTDEETEQIQQWKSEAHTFLTDHMKLSEADIETLKSETLDPDYHYPSYSQCEKYIKKHYKGK